MVRVPLSVHPHVRGEEACLRASCPRHYGSPPRAWGRGADRYSGGVRPRFTPTCVGKRPETSPLVAPPTVHPHVRGEEAPLFSEPPLYPRFTPTCVGKRRWVPITTEIFRGSPPRAWGRGPLFGSRQMKDIFTPTCVGKRKSQTPPLKPASVHPHVRGEEAHVVREGGRSVGSPPRAWGRDGCLPQSSREGRFTPTCVGKRCKTALPSGESAVHPHVRGEEDEYRGATRVSHGSPPRAWGRDWTNWSGTSRDRTRVTIPGSNLPLHNQGNPFIVPKCPSHHPHLPPPEP